MYSYSKKNADIAKDEIFIKDIQAIEADPEDEKVFYITYKVYCYKLESKSKQIT